MLAKARHRHAGRVSVRSRGLPACGSRRTVRRTRPDARLPTRAEGRRHAGSMSLRSDLRLTRPCERSGRDASRLRIASAARAFGRRVTGPTPASAARSNQIGVHDAVATYNGRHRLELRQLAFSGRLISGAPHLPRGFAWRQLAFASSWGSTPVDGSATGVSKFVATAAFRIPLKCGPGFLRVNHRRHVNSRCHVRRFLTNPRRHAGSARPQSRMESRRCLPDK